MNVPRRFILADRDGTLIVDKHYLHEPDEVELIPGVASAIRALATQGWSVVCLSNQSGVGRGLFGAESVEQVNTRVQDLMRTEGAEILKFYFCCDKPEVASTHRKPAPGMALDAARDLNFEFSQSIVVGDKSVDIELGKAIGSKAVLVRTGYGETTELKGDCEPDFVINSFADLPAIMNFF